MRMKYSLVGLNKVRYMKRFLLSGMLFLAMGGAAFAFENDIVIQVPPMDPALVQIDDPLFINNGSFSFSSTTFIGGTANILYETTGTLDYTNNGTMTSTPGFDFETFPESVGQPHMANSFANIANGTGGGVITANNIWGGNIFQLGGVDGTPPFPLNADIVGLAMVKIRATNVINSGLITMDNTGLIDVKGGSLDLRHGRMLMTGEPTFNSTDSGANGRGTNTVLPWETMQQLTPNSASSPVFTNSAGNQDQLSLFGSTAYFEDTNPPVGPNNTRIWRIVFLQDNSPTNVFAQVYFGGDFSIQWTGTYRDVRNNSLATNYFLLSDAPLTRRQRLNPFQITAGVPNEFTFNSSAVPFFTDPGADPSFSTEPFPGAVTNDFANVAGNPQPLSLGLTQVIGGSPTNLPGRVQLTSLDSLALADSTFSGMNYLQLNTPNFLGNSNSYIATPYADLNLGVTNGSLNVSNLLSPEVPGWTGTLAAFSGSYFFSVSNSVVDTNTTPATTNTTVITNDVRVLIVRSALVPTMPSSEKDVLIHAADNLVINDALTISDNFTSDTASLTIASNDVTTAYSATGRLIIAPQNYNWSFSLPNLQFLTNWGVISTANLGNFADNMPSLFSPRSQATPYQAFVNHGLISNEGIFVRANYFENDGLLQEPQFGGIALSIDSAAINVNGGLQAPQGPISIAADSLMISNSAVQSGRTLSFNTPCFLSDGYAFGNQFGHATNDVLPNVVTNGNDIVVSGGVQLLAQPKSGDLLGTTITDSSVDSLLSMNIWAGQDRGASPAGFAENSALGQLIFTSDGNPSRFMFQGLNNNNALYVDRIEFQDNTTNTDANGNFTSFIIQPGMKIYYADAVMNGVSIAEKLNGKNGGGFLWVSNYAGAFSSTNLSGVLYNEALVISPNIDSDGDGTVNSDDTTPIPDGLTFDVANAGPQTCTDGGGGGGTGSGNGGGSTNGSPTTGWLAFPAQQVASGSVSFKAAQGTYSGLFYETAGVKPSSSGFLTAKITGKGKFSAKLQLGGGSYSFSGIFDANGNYTNSVTGKNLSNLTVTLHLVNNDEIDGTVSGNGWTAQLLAFSSVKNASAFGVGKHSVVLSRNETNSTTASGDSFATMTLKKNGGIQWSGVLADGTKISQDSALGQNGVWPVYSSLYGGNGSLIGWLQVTNGTSDIGGSTIWVVPANQNSLYPSGLTNQLDATGSGKVTPSTGTQKTLILSGPDLPSPLTNSVTISKKTSQSGNVTFSTDSKNGLFTGSVFDPASSQTFSFQGAFLENGTGGGFFLNADKNQGGKVYLAPAN
jgi:hypothetical protein